MSGFAISHDKRAVFVACTVENGILLLGRQCNRITMRYTELMAVQIAPGMHRLWWLVVSSGYPYAQFLGSFPTT